MKSFLFPLAVLVSSTMAQTTSACGADYIVESCLASQKAALNACTATDYACHCNGWKNLIKYSAYSPQRRIPPSNTNAPTAATSTAPTTRGNVRPRPCPYLRPLS
jgi:hypothetical protein